MVIMPNALKIEEIKIIKMIIGAIYFVITTKRVSLLNAEFNLTSSEMAAGFMI